MGVSKRVAWSAPLPLAEIKAIGKVTDSTVNDVLLAAAAGALRRYLEGRDEPVDEDLNLRALVPVNLRPLDEVDDLGNRFGLVLLSLPVGMEKPRQRLDELKRRMRALKDSPEAAVAFGILGAMGLTPADMANRLTRFFGLKASAVMTNVPGPRQPLYMAGGAVQNIMFWVPAPGRLGLGVSIFSYAGTVLVGIATDARRVPDPETLAAHFEAEVAQMRRWTHPPRAKKKAEGEHCAAHTQTGRPCRNRATPGSRYCRRHANQN
jgi:WS/DGAT/MGAT family acyltransferase